MKTPFMQNNVTNYAVMALCSHGPMWYDGLYSYGLYKYGRI